VRKNGVTFAKVIEGVRFRLSDQGVRIAEAPAPFKLAWWPSRPSIEQQLLSDHGVASGTKQLIEDFDTEVKAIHECLDKLGHVPSFAEWQNTKDRNARRVHKGLNQRATALCCLGADRISPPPPWRCGIPHFRAPGSSRRKAADRCALSG
jgi:hypothetical protein